MKGVAKDYSHVCRQVRPRLGIICGQPLYNCVNYLIPVLWVSPHPHELVRFMQCILYSALLLTRIIPWKE